MRHDLFAGYTALPPVPDTGWKPPGTFPRLDSAKIICIDVETHDPLLTTHGPGSIRRDGHIVGISVGTEDGARFYFPMRHEVGGGNMDAEQVLRWARNELSRPGQTKVGANLLYDCEWLASEGVDVTGPFYDVQYAEPLLDENARSYSLEALSQKYLGEGKNSNAMYEWCAQAYGGKPGRNQAANIYRAPAALVGPYAMGDVDLPLHIREAQLPLLKADGLLDLLDLEHAQLAPLLAMRRRGVRVDVAAAERLDAELERRVALFREEHRVNIWAAADIARRCDALGIVYPRTAKTGVPSFTSEWFAANQQHPFAAALAKARTADKARGTFVRGYVLDAHVNGRVHAQFHPLRKGSDTDGMRGTVSGRYSSNSPNLQNIPARDPELGPLIRGLFLPEEGEDWVRFDWSQIEFRLLVHYGGKSASEALRMYRNDPTTDFHAMVSALTGIDRKPAKNLSFGLIYGLGKEKMAAALGRSREATDALFEQYHALLPFAKGAYSKAEQVASQRGYITTLLGRRRRFNLWEPRAYGEQDGQALPREAAAAKWGVGIRRAYTHKALNALLQGSAADIMKKALAQYWASAGRNALGAPLAIVHDEFAFSAPRTSEARRALAEVHHIMENCVTLRVPLRAEREEGPNWGALARVGPKTPVETGQAS